MKPKLTIPDRAIASIIFGFLSLFTLHIYAQLMWRTSPSSDKAADTMGSILDTLETARRALSVIGLLWCIWSWCKEWWLPAAVATLFTALVLFMAFFIDT